MAMQPSVFTREALAVELGRDRRTIAKALRDVRPDGELNGRPAWRLTTALDAMRKRERANRGDGDDVDSLCDEMERVAAQLEASLDCLRREPDVATRRIMVRNIGGGVGVLDELMERAAADAKPHEQGILQIVRDRVVGDAINEILSLCEWT